MSRFFLYFLSCTFEPGFDRVECAVHCLGDFVVGESLGFSEREYCLVLRCECLGDLVQEFFVFCGDVGCAGGGEEVCYFVAMLFQEFVQGMGFFSGVLPEEVLAMTDCDAV